MDTAAYLTNQGWLGLGHSLHPAGRGLKRPLLVSQKSNALGIGKKKHDAHADQWWARAFDSSLKGLEVGKNETTGATNSVKSGSWGTLDMIKAGGGKWAGKGGLYAGFVQGEGLSGTISQGNLVTEETDLRITKAIVIQETGERLSRKRKRTVEDHRATDAKAERRRTGKEDTVTTQASSDDKEIIQDLNITLKKPSSKKKQLQRRQESRSAEGTSATIV